MTEFYGERSNTPGSDGYESEPTSDDEPHRVLYIELPDKVITVNVDPDRPSPIQLLALHQSLKYEGVSQFRFYAGNKKGETDDISGLWDE